MQTLEIQSGHVTTTIQADEIKVKCWLIFVKGLKGRFKTPDDIDNGLLRIGNETYNTDDGHLFANPVKFCLVDKDKEHYDEVYELAARDCAMTAMLRLQANPQELAQMKKVIELNFLIFLFPISIFLLPTFVFS